MQRVDHSKAAFIKLIMDYWKYMYFKSSDLLARLQSILLLKKHLPRNENDLYGGQDDKKSGRTGHIILELWIRLLPIIQLGVKAFKA